jgi:hypothetical protein
MGRALPVEGVVVGVARRGVRFSTGATRSPDLPTHVGEDVEVCSPPRRPNFVTPKPTEAACPKPVFDHGHRRPQHHRRFAGGVQAGEGPQTNLAWERSCPTAQSQLRHDWAFSLGLPGRTR